MSLCVRPRPGHCLVIPPPPRGGGGVQRPKKNCVPKIGLQFPAPLTNFIFCLRKIFLMWVGGLARAPNNPRGVTKQWPGPDMPSHSSGPLGRASGPSPFAQHRSSSRIHREAVLPPRCPLAHVVCGSPRGPRVTLTLTWTAQVPPPVPLSPPQCPSPTIPRGCRRAWPSCTP